MKKKVQLLLMIAVFTLLFATTTFATITPPKVEGVHQIKNTEDINLTPFYACTLDIAWNTVNGEDIRYEVVMSSDGVNWSTLSSDEMNSKYHSWYGSLQRFDMYSGKIYYLKVRAFEHSLSQNVYGEYSDVIQILTPIKKNIRQIAATPSTATLQWDKFDGATAYQVFEVNRYDRTERLIATTKEPYCTVKKLNIYTHTIGVRAIIAGEITTSISNLNCYSDYLVYAPEIMHFSKILVLNDRQIRLSSNDAQNLWSYEIYNYKNKRVKVGMSNISQYGADLKIKNIKRQFYKVRARGYRTLNNKKLYGKWSKYAYFAPQTKVTIKSIENKTSGYKLKLSWKKIKGADNYTVYMTSGHPTGRKTRFKKVVTTKKTSVKISKFKKKKLHEAGVYRIYVTANKKVGKTIYKSSAVDEYMVCRGDY